MGDTSQGYLAIVKETVPGVAPATPAFRYIDFTDEDLVLNVQQVRSTAVNPSRVVTSTRRAGKDVGGGFRFELYSALEVDTILKAIAGNTFAGTPMLAKVGGPTVDSFTLERKLSSTDYRLFSGCRFNTAEFTVTPEQNVMVRAAVVGFTETTRATPITGATYAGPGATPKLNALDVPTISMSRGLTLTLDYQSLNFTVNNQLAARKRIGPNSIRNIGMGQALVTGSFSAYVGDGQLADAFLADVRFDLNISVSAAAAGYGLHFQNCQFSSYNDNNTGNNDEFMAQVEFEATLDTNYGSSFAFEKL